MNNKPKQFSNLSIWWLDYAILNTNSINFKFSLTNNIFYININNNNFLNFFIINKKNLNSIHFYILDNVIISSENKYFLTYQSIFFDFKIFIITRYNKHLNSISKIYFGSGWQEREAKEFNNVPFIGLNDTRKLLSNYNYNAEIQYNNYNNILNDIQI